MTVSTPIKLRDLDSLTQLRDEAQLQSHLFKAELKDHWLETEVRWRELQEQTGAVGHAAEHCGSELAAAMSLMDDALRDVYADIRNSLQRH